MASTIAATGYVEQPLTKLVALIAASSTFRDAVGAASAQIAEEQYIFVRESQGDARSRVVVDWEDRSWERQGRTKFFMTGVAKLTFEHCVEHDEYQGGFQDAGREFGNIIGGMESDWLNALDTQYTASTALYPEVFNIDGPDVLLPDDDESQGEYVFTAAWDFLIKQAM